MNSALLLAIASMNLSLLDLLGYSGLGPGAGLVLRRTRHAH